MAPFNPEYAEWWSATKSGAVIHHDNDNNFSSSFWDGDVDDHRQEDEADEVDNGNLDFTLF
jgi:hypothetical protein